MATYMMIVAGVLATDQESPTLSALDIKQIFNCVPESGRDTARLALEHHDNMAVINLIVSLPDTCPDQIDTIWGTLERAD